MKCELCHSADAEVAINKVVDGEKRELYVCKKCAEGESAEKRMLDMAGKALGEAISKIPEDFFKDILDEIVSGGPEKVIDNPIDAHRGTPCKACGCTPVDFAEYSRAGCPECYANLRDGVAPMIRDMHKGVSHVGKRPARELDKAAVAKARAAIRRGLSKKRIDVESELGTVVVSSRVRLARNVEGRPFPNWMTREQLESSAKELVQAVAGLDFGVPVFSHLTDKTPGDRMAVAQMESTGVVSHDLAEAEPGTTGFVAMDGARMGGSFFSVMVNEEDALRIQVVRNDYDLDSALAAAEAIDDLVSASVKYAFDTRLGYLTACPSNLGTGMRASVMLYLPAIGLMDDFNRVCNAAEALGFVVRGSRGEGSGVDSSLVQISTNGTLGRTEQAVVALLRETVDEIVRCELLAREAILDDDPHFLNDYVSRALALLSGSYMIREDEARAAVNAVGLGVELGLVGRLRPEDVGKMREWCVDSFLAAHLAAKQKEFEPLDVDIYRAGQLRTFAKGLRFTPALSKRRTGK